MSADRQRRTRAWLATALTGSGGAATITPSAGFSVSATSDTTGKHLQRSTGWVIPAQGVILWWGDITAVTSTVSNAVSGYMVGHVGSSTSKAGLYLAVDAAGDTLSMGRRAASGGAGARFEHELGSSVIGGPARLYWGTWGLNGEASECGVGDYHDGDLTTDATAMKTGAGDSPGFLARDTSVAGDGSVATTRAWTAMLSRMPTEEEWANLAAGNLDILRSTSNVNFGLLPASSGDITDPADVEDIGTDGGDWNDNTRGTGAVEVQGVGL